MRHIGIVLALFCFPNLTAVADTVIFEDGRSANDAKVIQWSSDSGWLIDLEGTGKARFHKEGISRVSIEHYQVQDVRQVKQAVAGLTQSRSDIQALTQQVNTLYQLVAAIRQELVQAEQRLGEAIVGQRQSSRQQIGQINQNRRTESALPGQIDAVFTGSDRVGNGYVAYGRVLNNSPHPVSDVVVLYTFQVRTGHVADRATVIVPEGGGVIPPGGSYRFRITGLTSNPSSAGRFAAQLRVQSASVAQTGAPGR